MEDLTKGFVKILPFDREEFKKKKLPRDNPPGTREETSYLHMMTVGLFETYKACDPEMKTFMFHRPKRYITSPSERKRRFPSSAVQMGGLRVLVAIENGGTDNEEFDLILAANDEIENEKSGRLYIAKEVLGKGTFGQVVHVIEKKSGREFAAKIIKSKKNYPQFVLNYEVKILSVLNRFERKLRDGKVSLKGIEPQKQTRIISLYEKFMFKNHMVLIMEKLDMSVFDLLKIVNFQGFTLNVIRKFGRYILEGLCILKKNKIVHCDLKPENILLINKSSHKLKIIDLGSACSEKLFPFVYIQSRYYRAPEVILGLPFTSAIDMWSFGCILLELYLGIPIFPGNSLYDMMRKIVRFTG